MSEALHFSGSHGSIRCIFRIKGSLVWHMQIISGNLFLQGISMNPDTCSRQIIIGISHTTGLLAIKTYWPVLRYGKI